MELMSQTGLDLRDLLADKENITSPVEAMRAIMTRGKEKGWTTAKLFGVFLEEGSTQEKVGFEKFQSGLRLLGLEISDGDARVIFESFDTDKSGTIELSEFTHWCLDIPAVAWRAERVRRMVEGAGDVGDAAAAMAEEAAQAQVKPPPPPTGLESERPQHPLGTMIYEGSKLFWRSGDSLRIAMHENKELHCITISTILEGGPEAFPALRVDIGLIPVTGEEDILNKVVELLEFEKPGPAAKEAIQALTEEARANLFEKARAAVISEYLLARLKIIERQAPTGDASGDEAVVAAAKAAARLENPEDPPKDGERRSKQENEAPRARKKSSTRNGGRSRANSRPEDPRAVSSTVSVTQSGSIFPTREPTPALVRLARDRDGEGDNGAGFLLLVDKLCFREVHKFAKRVSREDFERVEREVNQGLAEGHAVIQTAEMAQRRTHSSLNNQELTTHNAAAAIAKASEIFSAPSPSVAAQPRSSGREPQTPPVDAKEAAADASSPATRAGESEVVTSSSALPSTEGSKRSSGPSRFAASTKSSAERHAHSHIVRQRVSSTQKRSSRGNSFSGESGSSTRLSGSSSSTDKSKRSSQEAQVAANPSPSATWKSRGSATTEAKQPT